MAMPSLAQPTEAGRRAADRSPAELCRAYRTAAVHGTSLPSDALRCLAMQGHLFPRKESLMESVEPFVPKGPRPEWRMIYEDLLVGKEFGDVVLFEDLNRVLKRAFLPARSPIYRAMKQLRNHDNRQLAPLRGQGYRVVQPREHEDVAVKEQRSGRRKVDKAVDIATHVEKSQLTTQELQRIQRLELDLRRQKAALRFVTERVENQQLVIDAHQQAVTSQAEQIATLSRDVDALKEGLRRHGYLDK